MLRRKNTTILSEIQQHFSSTEKAVQTLFELLKSLKIAKSLHAVRCLIADDTDLPKRGRCLELLSRIYSHVMHSFNYEFKGWVMDSLKKLIISEYS